MQKMRNSGIVPAVSEYRATRLHWTVLFWLHAPKPAGAHFRGDFDGTYAFPLLVGHDHVGDPGNYSVFDTCLGTTIGG